jgi:8-oxo-dGTP pyrophosphatase MutT (NUDIX family)
MQLDPALRARIQKQLDMFAVQPAQVQSHHHAAAVAVAVAEEGLGAQLPGFPAPPEWSTRAALILTRRALGLGNHPGQWAMPGGRIDRGETPEAAALRELWEEVGLQLAPDAVMGRLDDFVTRSGFAITPVVVWAGAARELVPNPGEVASIHRVPLEEFMREDAPFLDPIDDSEHPVLRMPVGSHWVAAPTAAFIYQFREVCLAGRTTRVAHFEQPLFARK